MAEFFRLGLLIGLCEPATAVRWADSIVAAEPSPHSAFIELCIASSQPVNTVITLLDDVPGQATPDLPARMLLGHASRLLSTRSFTPEQILLRLERNRRSFPDSLEPRLDHLDTAYYLVCDGSFGTLEGIRHDIATFLREYESYAPDEPPPARP